MSVSSIRQWLEDNNDLAWVLLAIIILVLYICSQIYTNYYPMQGVIIQVPEGSIVQRGTARRKGWLDIVVQGKHQMFECGKAIENSFCSSFKDNIIVNNAVIKELTCTNNYCKSILLQGNFNSDLKILISYQASPELIYHYTHLVQIFIYMKYLLYFFMINFLILLFTRGGVDKPFQLKNIKHSLKNIVRI